MNKKINLLCRVLWLLPLWLSISWGGYAQPLNGNYTIGGLFPDYDDFAEAIAALQDEGVSGAVVFDVRDALYFGQLRIDSIAGLSADNTLTFRSESGDASQAMIEYENEAFSDSSYVLGIFGTDYLRFEGIGFRDLYAYGTTVFVSGGSNHLSFIDCLFDSAPEGSGDLLYVESFSDQDQSVDHLLVQDCVFQNAEVGIDFGWYLFGLFASERHQNNRIIGNTFLELAGAALQTSNQLDLLFEHNYYNSARAEGFWDIVVDISACDNTIVNANQIYSQNLDLGIRIISNLDDETETETLVFNNMISLRGETATALSIDEGQFALVAHNSLVVSAGTNPALFIETPQTVQSLNNICWNEGMGPAMAFETSYLGLEAPRVDHNLYYTEGPVILEAGNDDYADFDEWKTALEIDANSIFADPQFNSVDELRSTNPLLDGTGTPLDEVTEDIDGDARDPLAPDIGADEFGAASGSVDLLVSALVSPAELACDLTEPVPLIVTVSNFGDAEASGFTLSYRLNGGALLEEMPSDLQIPGQGSVEYAFEELIDLSGFGLFELELDVQIAGDTNTDNNLLQTSINSGQLLDPITGLSPPNGSYLDWDELDFSWSFVPNAEYYDFYRWKVGQEKPAAPHETGLTEILYELYFGQVNQDTTYYWQVEAWDGACMVESDIYTFTYSDEGGVDAVDLTMSNLQMDSEPFAGTSLDISYQVTNIGTIGTGSDTWFDMIFLSDDELWDDEDQLIGGVNNLSGLEPGESYEQTGFIDLEFQPVGDYYIIMVADAFNDIQEAVSDNNVIAFPVNIQTLPPADLQVSDIQIPNNAFSGTAINVQWTVENKGVATTNADEWRDYLFLSDSEFLDLDQAILLGEQAREDFLDIDESYNSSLEVELAPEIFGSYYLHVFTDFEQQVYEQAFDGNNVGTSSAIEITLSPPVDLVIDNIVAPASASIGDYIEIEYNLINQGGSAVEQDRYWRDSLYVFGEEELVDSLASFRTVNFHSGPMEIGESRAMRKFLSMPRNTNEDQFVFIQADPQDTIFEYTFNQNNLARSSAITLLSPDLQIQNLDAPATAMSGDSIIVNYQLYNDGPGNLVNHIWKEQGYLSASSQLDVANAIALNFESYNDDLSAGLAVDRSLKLKIADGISGTYFLHLMADSDEDVFEATKEANNSTSVQIEIVLSPSPDLFVSEVNLQGDNLNAGTSYPLSFTVENTGAANAEGEWTDYIYISEYPEWDSTEVYFIKQIRREEALPAGESYSVATEILIPMLSALTPGLDNVDVYIYVLTDAVDAVYEHNAEDNNIGQSLPVFASCPVRPELEVTELFLQESTAVSGQNIDLSWTVLNNGSDPGYWDYEYWYDGVYLSTDISWDESDIFVTDWVFHTPLVMDSAYSWQGDFDIPFGISGNHYALLVSDHTDLVADTDRSNNVKVMLDEQGDPVSINVEALPSPDLVFEELNLPEDAISGQPYSVSWTVANEGDGPTLSGGWKLSAYLSQDQQYQANDLQDYHEFVGSLEVGQSYSGSFDLSIPQYLSGNLLLHLLLDATDAEFEAAGEDNNLHSHGFQTVLPAPTDLIVRSIDFPDAVGHNELIDLAWEVKNIGVNPAVGESRDAIYISENQSLEVGDVLLGIQETELTLAPTASLMQTGQFPAPAVQQGEYYIIARADLQNNIHEEQTENNILVSEDKIQISIPELPLETLTEANLKHEQGLYYQIQIPDELEGETLLISLDTEEENSINELYLAHESMPTRAVHDFVFSLPLSSNQQLIVNQLQAGTYYLLVYGTQEAMQDQEIDLFAEIKFFEIASMQSNEGGNTGTVTVKIDGYRFDGVTEAVLSAAGLGSISAMNIFPVDNTTFFARFDLNGKALGLYDLELSKANAENTSKTEVFSIVPGEESQLIYSVDVPEATRLNRVVPYTISYANDGNVDVPVPVRNLQSLGGAPVSLNSELVSAGSDTSLTISFSEQNGPEDILRPGATSSVTFYAFSSEALRFRVTK